MANKITKKCSNCHLKFIPITKRQLYCSKPCANKAYKDKNPNYYKKYKPQKISCEEDMENMMADRNSYDYLQG